MSAISRVQAGGESGAFKASPEIEARIQHMQGGGQALPKTERGFFEGRMGYDFSRVRVHTDANAVQTSRALQARAFTVGKHIAFNAGAYQPGTNAGRRLLGHELTHVVQQGVAGVQRKGRRARPGGVREKSQVLRYLQRLGGEAQAEGLALYRKEIAAFQRQHSPEKIAAHQQRILELQRSVDIRERDSSQTLRRKGKPEPEKKVTINVTKLHGSSGSATSALDFANTKVYNQANIKLEKGKEETLNKAKSKKIIGKNLILKEFTDPKKPTRQEKKLFKVNQESGAITMYYVKALSDGSTGEGFWPALGVGLVGFVVGNLGSNQTFSHELGHVLLNSGGHSTKAKNLMHPTIGDDKTELTSKQIKNLRKSPYAE
jgi:hypothetical protein